MAKKESDNNTNPAISNGEIGTIRDILMGHQISENESRFSAIEARIQKMEDNFNNKLKSLESKFNEENHLMNDEFNKKMENFDHLLSRTQQNFNEKVDLLRRQEREKLSTLLAQLSKSLLED